MLHTGIGLRQPHFAALAAGSAAGSGDLRPALAFVEVHSENFFADGGAALQLLQAVRGRYDVSLHGVGLGLGSAAGIDGWHLDRLARLVQRTEPLRVSDHASFARAALQPGQPPVHASDLLPIAFTDASLAILAANVQRVQDRLQRPILVENLAAYLRWPDDHIAEPEFFNLLARRTGCGLLLDLNNLVVNALNGGPRDAAAAVATACAWVDAVDAGIVGQFHLAGHDASGSTVLDDHGSRVGAAVWAVFGHAVQRLGPRPTLVEWDTAVPPLAVLLEEAASAEAVMA